MKKAYIVPKSTAYGSVEEITQAFGSPNTHDTIYIGGANLQNGGSPTLGIPSSGSVDGIIKPV